MDVLKDILDNVNDSVIIVDSRGKIVLFNNEAIRINKAISEVPIRVGLGFADVLSEGRREVVAEILRTVKRQKKPVRNYAEYLTPLGSTIILEVNFVPVLGPRKEMRYVNIICHDITSRKVYEQKMRAANADVSNLIENAHAVIFSVDSQGYVVEWNNHCVRLTGFSKEEVLSRKVADTLIRQSDTPLLNDLMAAILGNKPISNLEFPIQAKAGNEIIVMLSATPRTNTNGEVIGATLVGQDITELTSYRRSLEKQIKSRTEAIDQVLKKEKEAVEMKSRFVSIASHEFRTPLSSIDFATSFIKQNAATIGRRKLNEKVKVIERHVSYMSHLLDDVLTFNKNEKGSIRIIPAELDLDEFISQTVEDVCCSTRHSHHVCVSKWAAGRIVTDEKLLRNILSNLLTNAIKFSPGKEDVSLHVTGTTETVTFEVRDEGVGIPEEERDLIFQPFVRGRSTEQIAGTGLGLSIVKKAVELLNGSIHVCSRVDKGSVFTVTIPRTQGDRYNG